MHGRCYLNTLPKRADQQRVHACSLFRLRLICQVAPRRPRTLAIVEYNEMATLTVYVRPAKCDPGARLCKLNITGLFLDRFVSNEIASMGCKMAFT
jgi:hypothetical protein